MDKSSITKTERAKTPTLRILMLVGYSSGPSGVWQRCNDEAVAFAKQGHTVVIFSSDAVKGKPKQRANKFEEIIDKDYHVNIRRFPYTKLGGESYMAWNFKKEAIEYYPDLIITHSYRHTHSDKALKVAKILNQTRIINCKTVCVTHAPFVNNRSILAKTVVAVKDLFSNLNQFDKVIAISKWEIPIIKQLGVFPQKIKRIPNPIFDRYFEGEIKSGEGILFLGRYDPIKDLKTLIRGVSHSKSYNSITFVGSGREYDIEDIKFIEKVEKVDVKWNEPEYNIDKKIEILDDHEIFILPSLREAMPIALVEAMARGKIVIASRTDGAKELIQNNKNGFLFEIGNYKELGDILDKIKKMSDKTKQQIREEARASVNERRMSEIMKKWDSVLAKI